MEQQIAEHLQNELTKCIKCGTCRQECPMHQTLDDECYTARGKLRLISYYLDGKLALTDDLAEMLGKCVMCKSCTASCPSGVDTYQIFLRMRGEQVTEKGLSFTKQSVFCAIKHRRLFDLGLALGARFQWVMFKDAPVGPGKVARLPLPMAGFNQRRIIPQLAKKPLKRLVGSVVKAEQPRYTAAFFCGCMLSYVYPQTGLDLIGVLKRHGVQVILPQEQQCCGTPLFTSGETEIAIELIHRNLRLFDEVEADVIITGCGSCGLAWKTEFQHILPANDPYQAVAARLAAKTRDISEFLLEIGLDRKGLKPIWKRVTYHDSCHLHRGQKIHQQPRELIKAIPGIELVEMEEADGCCGSGGSFNLKYYQISRTINQRKNQHIRQTDATVVLTGCPACMMHLNDGLAQDGIAAEAVHVVALLAESYGLKGGGNDDHDR